MHGTRESSYQPEELSEVTTSHTGQTTCPEPRGSNPLDRMPNTFVLPGEVGALGKSKDKLGQERRESRPASELPREMSTVPYVGVSGRGARGKQGETHVRAHEHTHTYTHTRGSGVM